MFRFEAVGPFCEIGLANRYPRYATYNCSEDSIVSYFYKARYVYLQKVLLDAIEATFGIQCDISEFEEITRTVEIT